MSDDAAPKRVLASELLVHAFEARGYAAETMRLGGKKYLRITGPDNWMWLTPAGLVKYPMVFGAVTKISVSKRASYDYAALCGVSTPQTLVVPGASDDERALFLQQYAPLVVKPVDSYGSRGLTLNITTPEQLSTAIVEAQDTGSVEVLVQRQFGGQEARFTVLDDQVVSVLIRQTPQVVGDGLSTVAELIRRDNQARAALQLDYFVYPQLDARMVGAHMQSLIVPHDGEVVELSKDTLPANGASLLNVTNDVHESYKQTAVDLVKGLGSQFLVIDMLLEHYTQPQTDTNYVFLEFNTSPSLRLYHGVRSGEPVDMASILVDKIIETVRR